MVILYVFMNILVMMINEEMAIQSSNIIGTLILYAMYHVPTRPT